MRRKRKSKSTRKAGFPQENKTKKALSLNREEKQIINILHQAKHPLSLKDIAFANSRMSPDFCRKILSTLIEKQLVNKQRNKKFGLEKYLPLFQGELTLNPQGFGFIHSIQGGSQPIPSKDLYISKYNIGPAQHGDTVLSLITRTSRQGRTEGTIISVLKRNNSQLGGILSIGQNGEYLVFPEDPRFPFAVQVEVPENMQPNHGEGVLVELEESQTQNKLRRGRIVKLLGHPDSIQCQIGFVITKYNLPYTFNESTLTEVTSLAENLAEETVRRQDLRNIPHITIDGETAKDFDDAIAVLPHDTGLRLYVSIADVSHYVEVGSSLDNEAYERGTSVYFPGTVIPMLPEKLSNDLCSLLPDKDRLTVTAILDFDNSGTLLKKSFCRSIIHSHYRFTYTQVSKLLETNHGTDRMKTFLPMLKDAAHLANLLKTKRSKRGALGFTIPETHIELNSLSEVSSLKRTTITFSHNIIEEFMLSANEAVAQLFTEQNVKALYRVHETPDESKVEEFNIYTDNLGLKLPKPDGTPKWFAKVISAAKGSCNEYVINNLLLRSMKQAKYSADNIGHFSLAATDYTHFTSPIRRYPDLMVHRELCAFLDSSGKVKKNRSAGKCGNFLSSRERIAIKAERDLDSRLKCIFMEKHIGESFEAVISGVSESGLYFELVDLPVSCMSPLTELEDDIYLFEYRSHNLIAQNSGIHYQLGETLTVTIRRIDRMKNRILVTPKKLK